MKRSYTLYLQDIVDAITAIAKFTEAMSEEEFLADAKTQSAVVWKIALIGEATKHIPRGIRQKHKNVPLSKMAKMRDKISHAYFGIRHEIVWRVCKEELPTIQPTIGRILKDLKGGS